MSSKLSGLTVVLRAIKNVLYDKSIVEFSEFKVDEEEVVMTWDEVNFFLEVGVFDCDGGEPDCGCFRWFFIPKGFYNGQVGVECSDYISDAFEKILLDNLVVTE